MPKKHLKRHIRYQWQAPKQCKSQAAPAATSLCVLCMASAVHVATFIPFGIHTDLCWGTDRSTMPLDLHRPALETSLIPRGYGGLVLYSSNMGLLFCSSSCFSTWKNGGLCPDIHLLQIQDVQSSFKKACQTLSSFLFGLSPSPRNWWSEASSTSSWKQATPALLNASHSSWTFVGTSRRDLTQRSFSVRHWSLLANPISVV